MYLYRQEHQVSRFLVGLDKQGERLHTRLPPLLFHFYLQQLVNRANMLEPYAELERVASYHGAQLRWATPAEQEQLAEVTATLQTRIRERAEALVAGAAAAEPEPAAVRRQQVETALAHAETAEQHELAAARAVALRPDLVVCGLWYLEMRAAYEEEGGRPLPAALLRPPVVRAARLAPADDRLCWMKADQFSPRLAACLTAARRNWAEAERLLTTGAGDPHTWPPSPLRLPTVSLFPPGAPPPAPGCAGPTRGGPTRAAAARGPADRPDGYAAGARRHAAAVPRGRARVTADRPGW